MPGLFLSLLVVPMGPPNGPAVGPPALNRGDRIPYAGNVTLVADDAGRVSRRNYTIEVSLFVLDVTDAYTDCAVFTRLTPKGDPGVIAAVANVTGTAPAARPATPPTRLDRVRIDRRGRIVRLSPPDRPPPYPAGPKAPRQPIPPLSFDDPPEAETGMFLSLPEPYVTVGSAWTVPDGDRPALAYVAKGTDHHNGGQCLVVEAVQQSEGWADLAKVAVRWKREYRLTVSPSDGLARTVHRRIEQREGNVPVRTLEVKYEIQPVVPHAAKSYRDVRQEIETAVWFGSELDKLLTAGRKPDVEAIDRLRDRVKQYEDDRPATAFRPAVEAVRHRAEAVLAGRALGDGK